MTIFILYTVVNNFKFHIFNKLKDIKLGMLGLSNWYLVGLVYAVS